MAFLFGSMREGVTQSCSEALWQRNGISLQHRGQVAKDGNDILRANGGWNVAAPAVLGLGFRGGRQNNKTQNQQLVK